MTKHTKLTATQRTMLRLAADRGCLWSGRGGWNTAWVRRLEALGLVVKVSQGTWDAQWRLTDVGRALAQATP